jgi:hypothetical protein
MVDLIARCSNNPALLDDLRQAREGVLSRGEDDEPELGGEHRASRPPRAVAARLAAEGVQAVLDGYRAGATALDLAERFSISESSVSAFSAGRGAGSVAYLQTADPLASRPRFVHRLDRCTQLGSIQTFVPWSRDHRSYVEGARVASIPAVG